MKLFEKTLHSETKFEGRIITVKLDDVELEIEDEAVRAIARKALERKTGARGLRSIFEKVMTEIMYEIPSRDDVEKCIITKETIEEDSRPRLILKGGVIAESEETAS